MDDERIAALTAELAEALHETLESGIGPCGHAANDCPSTAGAADTAIRTLAMAGWLGRIDLADKITKLELGPDDIAVLTLAHVPSIEEAQRVADSMRSYTKRPTVVLTGGAAVTTLRDLVQGADPEWIHQAWAKINGDTLPTADQVMGILADEPRPAQPS